jgi:ferredoxin-NADP reductase
MNVYYENIDGMINIQRVLEDNGTNSIYFISGPPSMIKSFRQTIIATGVPEENVITDDWE